MRLEGGQHIVVEQLHGSGRKFRGMESRAGISAVTADCRLQADLANALEAPDEDGVNSHQSAQ